MRRILVMILSVLALGLGTHPASAAATLHGQPGTSIKDITQGNFAGGKYYVAPDGRGAAFDSLGGFQYFGVFAP